MGQLVVRSAPAVLFLVALIAAWDIAVRAFDLQPYLLPSPGRVWAAFLDVRGLLPAHIQATLTAALLGLFLACVLGALTASLLAGFAPVRRAVYPLLVVSQNVPMIVMAPLIVVWFGFGVMPKVLVVALICFFPIVVSTTDGLLRADRELVDLARSFGANRLRVLRSILIPSAVPSFFAGLQISATYAVLGAVIAEWMGASSGLGLFIMRSQTAFRLDRVFVAVAVIAAVSILLFALVHLTARAAMPWQYARGHTPEETNESDVTESTVPEPDLRPAVLDAQVRGARPALPGFIPRAARLRRERGGRPD